MFANARHRVIEARFIQLVEDASLPRPDHVEYEPEAVTFYWHGSRAAVIVDFDPEVPIEEFDSVESSVAERSDLRPRLDSNQRRAG